MLETLKAEFSKRFVPPLPCHQLSGAGPDDAPASDLAPRNPLEERFSSFSHLPRLPDCAYGESPAECSFPLLGANPGEAKIDAEMTSRT